MKYWPITLRPNRMERSLLPSRVVWFVQQAAPPPALLSLHKSVFTYRRDEVPPRPCSLFVMKRFLQILFAASFLVPISAFLTKTNVLAEGGDTPQIALSVLQASPGATIEITGGRFQPDIFVTFILVLNGSETQLGKILADDHGEFTTSILLPLELQIGQYEFRAVDEKNRVAIAPIAIIKDESGVDDPVSRQQDDGLLAPMPTLSANAPTPMLQSVSSSQSKPPDNSSIPFVWIAAGIGSILILGLMVGVKRKK